jgi:hypothetical protein
VRPKINNIYASNDSYAAYNEYTISKVKDIKAIISRHSFVSNMFRPFVTEIKENTPTRISKIEKTFTIRGDSSLGAT